MYTNKTLVRGLEASTSKQCGHYGTLHTYLGTVRPFVVARDAHTLVSDRDIPAARHILLRFIDYRLSTYYISSFVLPDTTNPLILDSSRDVRGVWMSNSIRCSRVLTKRVPDSELLSTRLNGPVHGWYPVTFSTVRVIEEERNRTQYISYLSQTVGKNGHLFYLGWGGMGRTASGSDRQRILE